MIPKINFSLLLYLIIICCFSVTNTYAQCDVKFTDDGGLDNPYNANTDTTYTFCPDVAGDVVTVTFTFVDIESSAGTGAQAGCWDFLSIFSGSGTAAPLQAVACGELDGDGGVPSDPTSLLQAGDFFTSTSADGCLTVTFSSDGSVQGEGWVADITCGPPPACVTPTGLSVSNITESAADLTWSSAETSFNVEWGVAGFALGSGTVESGVGNPFTLSGLAASTSYDYYVCAVCDDGAGGTIISDCTGPQTFTTDIAPPECGGIFFDTGGPVGQYDNSADESYTICPDTPGDVVTITFTFVDIETSTVAGIQGGCWDFLSIYNGSDTSTPIQLTACGELDGDGSVPSDPTSLLQAGDFFTSTAADGCLTITFSSDALVQQDGWAADITCAPPAACAPPAGLMASNIGGSSAELSWVSAETTFNIEWDTTGFTPGMGTMVNGVSNPFTLTGLMPETDYDYYVCAVCDDGAGGTITSNCTGPFSFTTDVACPAPTDLTVDNITETSADLSWTSTESTFDIEWGPTGFAPGMGTAVNGVNNPFTLGGLSAGTAYDYYVCAICDDGMGGTINSECVGPFTFATAVPVPTCSSGLFFDNGGPAAPYATNSSDSLTICPDMAGDIVTVTFTFVDMETTTGTGTQGGCWDFLSIYNGSGTTDTLQMTACGELDGDGGTPSVPESLLQAGDFFSSTAADGCLTFTFSSDASVQEQGWEATITCAPPSDCPQPSGIIAANIGGNSAELSWTSDETTFDIEWGISGFAPGTGTVVSGVSNPFTLTGLMPETDYDYYVCAVCDDGAGGTITSNCTGPFTFTTDVACPAPTDLAVDNITETSADLSWISTEATFNIEWDTTGFTPGMGTAVNGVNNPFTLGGLSAGTAYDYYVCAVCDDGMGGTINSECVGPFAFATAVPAPTCSSGLFFDNGGPTAPYAANSSDSLTICPDMAGDLVTVTFTFVDIETATVTGTQGGCWDFLSIYNGSGTVDTLQMTACGELDGDGSTPSVPESLLQAGDSFTSTAADGCLTFTFNSDGSVQEEGWEATISCAPPAGVSGCTNPCASNFDPTATEDDGSCMLPSCDDACALTVDSLDPATCECVNTAPEPDDGCDLTIDSFDAVSCVIINAEPDPDDGCDLTADSFDAINCEIINTAPDPNDGCDLTTDSFDAANCVIVNTPPDPDDGCDLTTDSFDAANCVVVNTPPDPNDGCDLTTDSFDAVNCVIVNTAPDPDDGCDLTTDSFDAANCVIVNTPPSVDDACPLTDDSFDAAMCAVVNAAPDPDDGCDNTIDSFDAANCVIINESTCPDGTTLNTIECLCETDVVSGCTNACANNFDPTANSDDGSCMFPDPDDGCDLTTDSYDTVNCVAINTPPNPDDGCALTSDSFDAAACAIVNAPPDVDDGCDLTTDSFDAATCAIVNTPPDVDDGCDLTADSFDAAACAIVNTPPDVDDGCDLTTDSFDAATCSVINTPNCPSNTTFDAANCECVTDAVLGCTDPCADNFDPTANTDDGSCVLPAEPETECYETATFNTTICVWDITGEQPPIDDGCDLTDDSFDAVNCVAVNTPNCPAGTTYDAANCACTSDPIPGCTDAMACNFDPTATVDDDSCLFATGCDTCASDGTVLDNPEVGDACDDGDNNTENDAIQADCTCAGTPIGIPGCTDATACNFDPTATVDDGSCVVPGDVCNDGSPLTINDTIQADCSCEGVDSGEAVPTVGEWGLIILALILLNLGVLYIRQTEIRIVND